MKPRPRGVHPGGDVKRYERIGQQQPGNSGLPGTDSLDAQTLEAGAGDRDVLADAEPSQRQRHGGMGASRGEPGYRGGKTSASENPRALPA